jgi:23S rRNA pseudouridine1911/1915/1917 synthase
MRNEFTIVVPPGKKPERLDVFLTHHVENATRSRVQRAIRTGNVLVNGRIARPSHPVVPGERISITLPTPPPRRAEPERIPLDIVYEDDDLLVVDKPAGMVTHPAHGNRTGTLVNALLYHTTELSGAGEADRPGIVHRLDKDTSGLLVVAKNENAHASLARQFSERTIVREYQAIVWGHLKQRSGLIEASLGRNRSDRKKIAVLAAGKPAATEYTVLEEFAYLSLVRLKLRTGRTHQIRVHLAHIGHPVFGDPVYNGRRIMAGNRSARQRAEVQMLLKLIRRQALHARTIGFVHPRTGKGLLFDSPLPTDMIAVIGRLKNPE